MAAPVQFVRSRTGLDLTGGEHEGEGGGEISALRIADWLSLTGQSVLEVTAGPVFEDTSGEITALREPAAPGTPTTCGCTSSRRTGRGSRRSCRSSAAPGSAATTSARG